MREIKTSTGPVVLVDDDDYEMLSKYRWHITAKGYVVRRPYVNGKKLKIVWMHRLVNKTPEGFITDHINHDKLDNRKCNLRTVTDAENMQNRSVSYKNKTGCSGVFLEPSGRYRARIRHQRKGIHLGMFDTAQEATKAYKAKAKELWGIEC